MNKKALLFYGVSACALAMVASVIASPSLAPSILNTNRIAQAEHTFEVPSTSTSFTEKTEKLSAYATSPSGYQFELEFTGFEKEGDDLTLQAGVWSTVTNVLPLDLGFDTFQVAFSSAVKEYHNYWSAVFF